LCFFSPGNHPRAGSFGLTNEKVVKISASNIRCSVVTESGKVATWLDDSVAHVCSKLEHSATAFPEFQVTSTLK
jgi:E3 ubiquitin-protein ligase EDD1